MLKEAGTLSGIKISKNSELQGKKIKVWFNGEIIEDKSEMSNPIELGEVYEVSTLK